MNWLPRFLSPPLPALFAKSREPLYSEIAFSRVLDYFTTVPDPDLMLQKAGIQRQHLRFLELDDEVAQCVETRKDAVIGTPWRLEPNHSRQSKWLMSELAPHFETLLRGVMSAVFYGYSVLEVTWKQSGAGRITIDRVDERNIEWFRIHPRLGWRYYPDDGSGGVDGLDCDPRKFLITVRHSTTRNPYGESLLSRLWFPVTWRREGWQMWLKFLETFGQPIIMGRVFNYAEFVDGMKKQGARSVFGWQGRSEDTITTITASAPGEFERLENALTKRIQKLILGQTLTSEVGSSGSYAAAKVHENVMDLKTVSDCRIVTATMQSLFNTWAQLNGWIAPTYVLANDIGLESERATRDAALLPVLTASGLKFTKNYFEDRYDYRSDDLMPAEPVDLGPSADSPPTGNDPAQAHAPLMTMAARPALTATQQEIEDLGADLLKEAPENPLDSARLRDAIFSATNEDDLRERLLVVWEDGPDSEFTQTLEKAQFMASVIGYVSAEERRA